MTGCGISQTLTRVTPPPSSFLQVHRATSHRVLIGGASYTPVGYLAPIRRKETKKHEAVEWKLVQVCLLVVANVSVLVPWLCSWSSFVWREHIFLGSGTSWFSCFVCVCMCSLWLATYTRFLLGFFLAVGSGVLLYSFYFDFHLFSCFLAVLLIYWFELLPPMFQFLFFFCSKLIKDFPFPSVTDGF